MNRASQLFLTLGVLFLFVMVFGPDVVPPNTDRSASGPMRGPSSVGAADSSYADLYCQGSLTPKSAQVISDDGSVGYKEADLKVGFAQILALTQDEGREYREQPAKIHRIIKARANGLCRLFDARFPESKRYETTEVLDGPVYSAESRDCLKASHSSESAKAETLVFKSLVCVAESDPAEDEVHAVEPSKLPISSPKSVQ